jgi:hypothetical protein
MESLTQAAGRLFGATYDPPPVNVTMSQKLSLIQSTRSVQ